MKNLVLDINDVARWISRTDEIIKRNGDKPATEIAASRVFQYMYHRSDLIGNLHKIMTESGLDFRLWLPDVSALLAEKAEEIDPENTRRWFEKFTEKMEAAIQEATKTELAWAA